jgi:hypothetical protein
MRQPVMVFHWLASGRMSGVDFMAGEQIKAECGDSCHILFYNIREVPKLHDIV